jgi:hypothetical protein
MTDLRLDLLVLCLFIATTIIGFAWRRSVVYGFNRITPYRI